VDGDGGQDLGGHGFERDMVLGVGGGHGGACQPDLAVLVLVCPSCRVALDVLEPGRASMVLVGSSLSTIIITSFLVSRTLSAFPDKQSVVTGRGYTRQPGRGRD
jgi:hypothetical protein